MKIYNVMQYGAKGDGKTNDAFSIQHAIDDCAKNGGGQVVLPSGYTFYSDSIRLKKNVDFHIQKGATIKATSNIDGYIRPNKLINDPKTALIGNPVSMLMKQTVAQFQVRVRLMLTATHSLRVKTNIM